MRWLKHPPVTRAIGLLAERTPAWCVYHTLDHTLDVIREAEYFASCDRVSERERELLAIAAAFHDIGFLESREPRNEVLAAAAAARAMSEEGGFSPEEIHAVSEMILDTAVVVTPEGPRMTPRSKLAGYLLDADVSNFGRSDFFEKLELVRRESGSAMNVQFLSSVERLMVGHCWHTPAALGEREAMKQRNLTALRERIAGQA